MSDPYADEVERLLAAEVAGFGWEAPPPDDSDTPHAVNWRRMSEEAAPAEWAALREWVEWFTVRYDIPASVVPIC